MHILAVLANDKKKSLNRYMLETITSHLTSQGHTVDVLDLYTHCHEIPFYVQPKPENSITQSTLEDSPFFQDHKKRFMAADMLVIVAPIYWYSVPGILKTWLDLITNFAWKYKGQRYATAHHTIKKVVLVTTMAMPWIHKTIVLGNAIKRHLREIFRFIAIPSIVIHEITSVYKKTPQQVQKHLSSILNSLS